MLEIKFKQLLNLAYDGVFFSVEIKVSNLE